MLNQVMAYCKNHFDRSREIEEYEIVTDGIVGSFGETYVVGQYIWIVNSFVNDGVYKITGVTSSKLTLDYTMVAENTGESITVYGLKPPTDFLQVVEDIATWVDGNGGKEGIAGESIDSYSISFGTGAGGQMANTWQVAFAPRLEAYRQVFETPGRNYTSNWR